jgi:hypothetical protein
MEVHLLDRTHHELITHLSIRREHLTISFPKGKAGQFYAKFCVPQYQRLGGMVLSK